MPVLVTRPAAQAALWVERLRAAGIDARALPLIGISAPADVQPVRAAWHALPEVATVVFVSPNAVEGFFAARPDGAHWPDRLRAATVGPGSAASLRAHGLADAQVDAPPANAPELWDSEGLWQVLEQQPWTGRRVLVARGDGGRDWLSQRLRERGAQVNELSVYRRTVPLWDAHERGLAEQALRQPRAHTWLLSSSLAVGHLGRLLPLATRDDWRDARAVATHPRIAEAARRHGFGRVDLASAALDDVVRSIESPT